MHDALKLVLLEIRLIWQLHTEYYSLTKYGKCKQVRESRSLPLELGLSDSDTRLESLETRLETDSSRGLTRQYEYCLARHKASIYQPLQFSHQPPFCPPPPYPLPPFKPPPLLPAKPHLALKYPQTLSKPPSLLTGTPIIRQPPFSRHLVHPCYPPTPN